MLPIHAEAKTITELFTGPGFLKCSRSGCQQAATVKLLWNNPKVHDPQRRKVWLACEEHEDWLSTYLTERGFFKAAQPLEKPRKGSDRNDD